MSDRRRASLPPAMPTERVWGDNDPDAAKYEKGGPSEFGEEVRRGPYPNSQAPAMPTENASIRTILAHRARKCITIAEAFLGKTASVSDVEDQALSMMDWSDRQINAAYEKAAEVDKETGNVHLTAKDDLDKDGYDDPIDPSKDDDDEDEDGRSKLAWAPKVVEVADKAKMEKSIEEMMAEVGVGLDPGGKATLKSKIMSLILAADKSEAKGDSKFAAMSRTIMANVRDVRDEDERNDRVSSILKMAAEEEKATKPWEKAVEEADEVTKTASKEERYLRACLDTLSKFPAERRLKKIAAFGKIIKMADENVASLFTSERFVSPNTPMAQEANSNPGSLSGGDNEFSELQTKVLTNTLGQDGGGAISRDELDPMGMSDDDSSPDFDFGGESDAHEEAESVEHEESETEEEEAAEEAGESEGDEADELDMFNKEEEEEEEPEPVVKTASRKAIQTPKPRAMSRVASPKRLGSVVKAPTDSDFKKLSSMWSAPPDVSQYFGTTPTEMEIKDYNK